MAVGVGPVSPADGFGDLPDPADLAGGDPAGQEDLEASAVAGVPGHGDGFGCGDGEGDLGVVAGPDRFVAGQADVGGHERAGVPPAQFPDPLMGQGVGRQHRHQVDTPPTTTAANTARGQPGAVDPAGQALGHQVHEIDHSLTLPANGRPPPARGGVAAAENPRFPCLEQDPLMWR